jgi:hypothetical protein
MRTLSALLLLLAATAVAGCGSTKTMTTTGATAGELPRAIVPWHEIGGVAIGMEKQSVVYRLGFGKADPYDDAVYPTPDKKSLVVNYGTKASGQPGRVITLGTDSAYFSTSDGVAVGILIPLTRCQMVNGRCVHHWKGFVLGHDPEVGTPAWRRYDTYGRLKIDVELLMDKQRVFGIRLYLCGPAAACPPTLANGAG